MMNNDTLKMVLAGATKESVMSMVSFAIDHDPNKIEQVLSVLLGNGEPVHRSAESKTMDETRKGNVVPMKGRSPNGETKAKVREMQNSSAENAEPERKVASRRPWTEQEKADQSIRVKEALARKKAERLAASVAQ